MANFHGNLALKSLIMAEGELKELKYLHNQKREIVTAHSPFVNIHSM